MSCVFEPQEFPVVRGQTETLDFTFESAIVDYDFKMDVVEEGETSPTITFTVGSGITVDEDNQLVTVTYTPANTLSLSINKVYYSDLKVTRDDGSIRYVPLTFIHRPFNPTTT